MLTKSQYLINLCPEMQELRCSPNFDIRHKKRVPSKHLLPISSNEVSVRLNITFW